MSTTAPQTPPGETAPDNPVTSAEHAGLASVERTGSRPAAPTDLVNHPPHYTAHPSGVECIQITEYMGFNVGNAMKYLWRADEKGNAIEDLHKAKWYVERELQRRAAAETRS